MKKKADNLIDALEPRQMAERRLAAETEIVPATPGDEDRLLHELQVHQIELEILNQELLSSQAELEISRARYFDLYDLAPVGYVTMTESGLIREANLTAGDLLGVPRSTLIRQALSRFVFPADQDNFYLFRQRLTATDAPQFTELRLVKQDGIEFWARFEANQLKPAGDLAVFRVVIIDITKNKQAEQVLLEAKSLAENSTRMKSEFLANMSHEIRTPMSVIVNYSELVLNLDASPQIRQYLHKIRLAMNNLLGILNDIIDISKLESGNMSIETACFSLDEILDELRRLFSPQAKDKRIALTIEANADVPVKLIGDSRCLRQILIHLLGNALKFTRQGSVVLEIELKSQGAKGVTLEFSVEDTGIGISETELSKLFLPFSQVDGSITRRFGGAGLGLAISHRLLQLMNSSILVNSTPGKGSRFSFQLALGIADGTGSPRAENETPTVKGGLTQKLSTAGKNFAGARILVAEDNELNQIFIKELLEMSGFSVETVDNGREVLAVLEKRRFDAVFLDIHMPEMGGMEVARRIREQSRFADLPLIAITADVRGDGRGKCFASGVNDYITKPFSAATLVAVLAKWLKPRD